MSAGFNITSLDIIDLPDDISNTSMCIVDDCSLAFQLGFKPKALWYAILKNDEMYDRLEIPKKSGGKRIIHRPSPMMEVLARQLLRKILNPIQEKLGDHVTAYRANRSTQMAVKQHIPPCPICDASSLDSYPKKHDCPRRGTYISIDLKDFFTTTRRSWIREYFYQVEGYNHYVSDLLAVLLTVRDFKNPRYGTKRERVNDPEYFTGAPQGSPTSGAICNLVANHRLDKYILPYLEKLNSTYGLTGVNKWVYTRYADDMAFTCGKYLTYAERNVVLDQITQICTRNGYVVNDKKTRIWDGIHRKQLLGVVFNMRPNVTKTRYRTLRAITTNCLNRGFHTQWLKAERLSEEDFIAWLRGQINYVKQVNPRKGAALYTTFKAAMEAHSHGNHPTT